MHHGPDDVARPPTIKQDELKQLDVGEEEEGGWAGHHEEVDYTQEVVFSDSSDEVCVCVCVCVCTSFWACLCLKVCWAYTLYTSNKSLILKLLLVGLSFTVYNF